MNLKQLAQHIEHVAGLVELNEATDDDIAGLSVAFVQSQRHYVKECPDVVRALELTGPTLREARAGLAAALKALPRCSDDAQSLTPPDVAKRLGVTPETVIGWIKSGQLKASNVGKGYQRPRYRIAAEDVDRFLTKRQPELPPATKRSPTPKKSATKNYRT